MTAVNAMPNLLCLNVRQSPINDSLRDSSGPVLWVYILCRPLPAFSSVNLLPAPSATDVGLAIFLMSHVPEGLASPCCPTHRTEGVNNFSCPPTRGRCRQLLPDPPNRGCQQLQLAGRRRGLPADSRAGQQLGTEYANRWAGRVLRPALVY